jgi:hypothetical protein
MKKKYIFLLLVFFSLQIKAQNNIPAKTVIVPQNAAVNIFKVIDVVLSIDSAVHVTNGAGATKNYFKATINSIGKGTIQYQWVLVNSAYNPNSPNTNSSIVQGTLQLNGSGNDVLFAERDHVTHNANKKLTLQIISTIQIDSNTITF